jgi:hypothetical protein
MGILTALQGISDKWSIIWSWEKGTWKVRHRLVATPSVLPLDSLRQGNAYWIKTREAAEWVQ